MKRPLSECGAHLAGMSDLEDISDFRPTTPWPLVALDAGLRRIQERFDEDIELDWDELPTGDDRGAEWTYTLYLADSLSPRLLIDERYPDPAPEADGSAKIAEWPSGWRWRSQIGGAGEDGQYQWVTITGGRVDCANVSDLLTVAEEWAKTVHELVGSDPTRQSLTMKTTMQQHKEAGRSLPG